MSQFYVERIRQVYPELSIERVEPNTIGHNNDVIIVNRSFVFRFPKYLAGIKKLKEETAILEIVRELVDLPIPYPIYQSFDDIEVGKVFTGYSMITGTPLWKEAIINIHDDQLLDGLAVQLAQFLMQVHGTAMERIRPVFQENVKVEREIFEQLYMKIQRKLYPYMRTDAQEQIAKLFENFLETVQHHHIHQTLIHGDFGASNILWDSDRTQISGIIDFGGSRIGDPAYDFAGLLSSYGEKFVQKCLSSYPDGAALLDRARFYQSTFALQEALHGIENDDQEAFEEGIREYR